MPDFAAEQSDYCYEIPFFGYRRQLQRNTTNQGVSMIPVSRWQHEDGSVVEFSTAGWKSNDAAKTRWLTQMSDLSSSTPVISPLIRMWLEEYCRPLELPGPPEDFSPANDHNMLETGGDDIAFLPARDCQFQGSDERAKRRVRITKRSIDKACEEFFRSRGMPIKASGDVWRRAKAAFRSRHTE